jgi:hypothetical protein
MEMNSKSIAVDPASKLIIDRRFLFKVGEQTGQMGLVGEVRNRLCLVPNRVNAFFRNSKEMNADVNANRPVMSNR